MSAPHEHFTEARLLELALECGEPEAERESVRACPTCARRSRELAGFLDTCRATFVPERIVTAASADTLARSVLAATTREDPGWRGDLRLFGRFARARWRSSFLVRIAAASLLLHVAALPVLAYYGLVIVPERRGEFFTMIEPPRTLPVVAEEPPRDVELDELSADEIPETLEVDTAGLTVLNSIQWARFQLSRGAPVAVGEPATEVTRMLAARSRLIAGGERGVPASDGPEAPEAGASAVAHVLWLDVLLDRFLLERGVPPGFSGAVGIALARPERQADLVLAAAALARARSYGLLEGDEPAGLARLVERVQGPHQARARTLTSAALRPRAPLDRAWIAALAAAAEAELARDPIGSAWLAWGE